MILSDSAWPFMPVQSRSTFSIPVPPILLKTEALSRS
jgi:hypothetical protein